VHTSTKNTIINTAAYVFVSLIGIGASLFLGTQFPNSINKMFPDYNPSNVWVKKSELDVLMKENSKLKYENDVLKRRIKNPDDITPPPSITGDNYLPNKQWVKTDIPFEILDGKVTIKILKIYEHRTRKAASSVQVIVPLRSAFKNTRMFKGDSLEFTYLEQQYILTINDVMLQNQEVQVSVREA
jgi:hypothetical protein